MLSKFGNRRLVIEHLAPTSLIPNPRNARKHSARQINKIARSISRLGFAAPLIIDENNVVLCGNGRWQAAVQLGLETVPCIRVTDLDEGEKAMLALADNRIGDDSSFDQSVLKSLMIDLSALDLDLGVTGFEMGEIDFLIDGLGSAVAARPADVVPAVAAVAVTRPGDLWQLGRHRLLCGSALDAAAYEVLLEGELARMIFVDPPYNVPIQHHVSGLGKHQHREFAQASGEISLPQFRDEFLRPAHALLAQHSMDGSMHYSCMDWRSIATLIAACEGVYAELKNILVWVKRTGAMGSLYRSQHELVAVFKHGTAPHINNVELGKNGRYRTNVLDCPGANSFGRTRNSDLAAHPTVKPRALVADLIRDVTNRGDLVLDGFAGSGTTILAAEQTGRRAAAIEIDPLYCDVAIRRWQTQTRKTATLAGDGRTFDEIAADRARAETRSASEEDAA